MHKFWTFFFQIVKSEVMIFCLNNFLLFCFCSFFLKFISKSFISKTKKFQLHYFALIQIAFLSHNIRVFFRPMHRNVLSESLGSYYPETGDNGHPVLIKTNLLRYISQNTTLITTHIAYFHFYQTSVWWIPVQSTYNPLLYSRWNNKFSIWPQ